MPFESELVLCPACGHVSTVEDCDVLGADDGNLFCNWCSAEFNAQDAYDACRRALAAEEKRIVAEAARIREAIAQGGTY